MTDDNGMGPQGRLSMVLNEPWTSSFEALSEIAEEDAEEFEFWKAKRARARNRRLAALRAK